MTSTTDFSKKQLTTILSALDDAPRSPANKGEALRAIGRSAKRFGLTTDDVLGAAAGLVDGRMSPAEFRAELADREDHLDATPQVADEAEVPAPAGEGTPAGKLAPEPAPEAPDAADNAAYDDYPTRGTPADQGAWAARRDDMERDRQVAAQPAQAAEAPVEADRASPPAERKAKAKTAKPGKAAPAEKPTPRAGTKQAKMIEMLRRPEGATVEQIAEATGWQKHTIRGAISGALKKKLGLTVEATRTREVGPNQTGAKGSLTVYRILGPATGRQHANGSGTEIA